jgi:hypothetical protein
VPVEESFGQLNFEVSLKQKLLFENAEIVRNIHKYRKLSIKQANFYLSETPNCGIHPVFNLFLTYWFPNFWQSELTPSHLKCESHSFPSSKEYTYIYVHIYVCTYHCYDQGDQIVRFFDSWAKVYFV